MTDVRRRPWWGALKLARPSLLLFFLLLIPVSTIAGQLTLAWNPVNDASLVGYMVYYGPAAGSYGSSIDVGNTTSFTVTNLVEGATYHFAATSYDAAHAESGFSNDVSATVPYSAPVAQFSASTTSGTAPLGLNFSSTSTGTIATYSWTFGDTTTGNVQSPVHVYALPGTYSVSLTVTGPGGTNTKTINNYITVTKASSTAALASSMNPSTFGGSVTFTATVTGSAPTGTINFKDGATSIAGCTARGAGRQRQHPYRHLFHEFSCCRHPQHYRRLCR